MTPKKNKIDKYEIIRLLGSGTMGRVYKISIPELEKTAALKLFKPAKALIQRMGIDLLEQQFIKEARIIANIRHPHIVEVWNLEKKGSDLFYIMEYFCRNLGKLIGESYWADMASRQIPILKSVAYMTQILDGLSRLHQVGIVHRDIKPFNIMLDDFGGIKIVDFGLSKRRGERPLKQSTNIDIGTPFYSSPEQLANPDHADHRSDLYSAGILLFRMLTGLLPVKETPFVSQLNPMLNMDWDQFFYKSLSPRPKDRFQTADEMAAHLNELAETYQDHQENTCNSLSIANETKGKEQTSQLSGLSLRTRPQRILAKHAKKRFNINDLCQPDQYIENQFLPVCDGLIEDKTTGLVWQQSGSNFPVQWKDAQIYIDDLNRKRAGGYADWRLPTMDELLSLLSPLTLEQFCEKNEFFTIQKWLWSADSRSGRAVWTIDLEFGFVSCSDMLDFYFVKAVRSTDH